MFFLQDIKKKKKKTKKKKLGINLHLNIQKANTHKQSHRQTT